MSYTISDLIDAIDQPTYFKRLMDGHQANGVPWKSWLSTRNIGLSLTQIASKMFATLSGIGAATMRGMLLDYSVGAALKLFGKSQYQIEKTPAAFTSGRFIMIGVVSAPTFSFSAGQLTVGTLGTTNVRTFKNTDAGTLKPGTVNLGGQNGISITSKSGGGTVRFIASGPNVALSVVTVLGGFVVFNKTDSAGNPISTGSEIATAINIAVPTLVSATALGAGSAIIGVTPILDMGRGALALNFQATSPGPEWNLPIDSPLVLKTSYPGVTVVNPEYRFGTWIVAQGDAEESDDRYKLRCVSRWGTIGSAANEDAYVYWALQVPTGYQSSPVQHVKVLSGYWLGAMATFPSVTVVIAGAAGALSTDDVDAVSNNFYNPNKFPLGFQFSAVSASNLAVPITGTTYIFRKSGAQIADVQAAQINAITAYQRTLDIGQPIYTVGKVAGVLETASPFSAAIRNVDLSGMSTVITPGALQFPLLNIAGMNYQYV